MTRFSRRWSEQVRRQNWFAMAIDFGIVVAGVFLGIQAADWNESRKERAEERRYYAQIIDDLRADQDTLKIALERAKSLDAAAENTLRAMRSGIPRNVSPGEFAQAIHYAGFLYIPRTSKRTYDELISTGNLGLLQNEKAKAAIANYYFAFEDFRQWDELLRSQQARYWSATSGVLPRSVLRDAIRGRGSQLTDEQASQILAELRSRDGADDMLIGMAAHQERVRRDSEEIVKLGRDLIKELEPLASR